MQDLRKITFKNKTLACFSHFFVGRIVSENREDSKLIKKLNNAVEKPLEAYALSRDTIIKKFDEKEYDDVRQREEDKAEELEKISEIDCEVEMGKAVYDYVNYKIDEVVYSYKNRDGASGVQGGLDNDMICDMFEAIEAAEEIKKKGEDTESK